MLMGTTMAWFTDSVTSSVNTIKAGNLKIELGINVEATQLCLIKTKTPVHMICTGVLKNLN